MCISECLFEIENSLYILFAENFTSDFPIYYVTQYRSFSSIFVLQWNVSYESMASIASTQVLTA